MMKYMGANLKLELGTSVMHEHCVPILSELSSTLVEAGYRPFHEGMEGFLKEYTGSQIDLSSMWDALSLEDVERRLPGSFVLLFADDSGTLYFVDIDTGRFIHYSGEERVSVSFSGEPLVELDVFSYNDMDTRRSLDDFIEILLKHFGTRSPREQVIYYQAYPGETLFNALKTKMAQYSDPRMENAYSRIQNARERELLFEVKRAKSIAAKDISTLGVNNLDKERTERLLDYFSGADVGLLEKRYGVFCKSSGELVCVVESKPDLDKAKNLECPKCKKKLGEEEVETMYRSTQRLNDTLDNSRWMPSLIRDTLKDCGVPEEDIIVSRMHDKDEFDLIFLVAGVTIVCELKDRGVSLGDAYKFSAKFSRLSILVDNLSQTDEIRYGPRDRWERHSHRPGRFTAKSGLVPVLITTKSLDKDSDSFLADSMPDLWVIEDSDVAAKSKLGEMVFKFRSDWARRMLHFCSSRLVRDSVSSLAAGFTEAAIYQHFDETQTSGPET